MARQASVRNRSGYWISEAGGVLRTFGRVDVVSRDDAQRRLVASLVGVGALPSTTPIERHETPREASTLTVGDLRGRYLDWIKRNRSRRLHDEAKRHLERWVDHVGDRNALTITGNDLEAFQESLSHDGHAPLYVKKHITTVRACFNRGVKAGWIPPSFKPFAYVESIRLDPSPLLESDLPTAAEIATLFAHAKGAFRDMLTLYHATGARTHELIEMRVGDYQPNMKAIVLKRHKRSRTLREPVPRTITLNDTANDVMRRQTEGRPAEEFVFPTRTGRPNTSVLVGDMFARLRHRAGVRDTLTVYSFRHLWISEAMMASVDVMLVARMAGTSVRMIETVYGHWRTQSFTDAQARLDASRKRS